MYNLVGATLSVVLYTVNQVAVGKMRETVTRERAASHSRGGGYAGGGSGGGYGASEAGNYSAGYGDDERTRLIEQEHRDKMEMMGNQIDYSTSLITEREDAIKEIESTMLEVNEIYKDLSTLVVEQGAALGTSLRCVGVCTRHASHPIGCSYHLRSRSLSHLLSTR